MGLTKEALDGLLECLSADRELAAEAYEEIRRKLITFFEFRGCLTPQDQADETIHRVARRIQELYYSARWLHLTDHEWAAVEIGCDPAGYKSQ